MDNNSGVERIKHLETIISELQTKVETGKIVEFEYEHTPTVRDIAKSPGGRRLLEIVARGEADYAQLCQHFAAFLPDLKRIKAASALPREPHWTNSWFPVVDGLSLYCMLRSRHPRRYIEVGSGNSTKFARQAVIDGSLSTQIISIDPFPRAEIDDLCDLVVRRKLEDFNFADIGGIEPTDIFFLDSSHRVSQGCDVAVFFSELIVGLPEGIVYGIHDITLPDTDYPQSWLMRHYGEQYLLAAYILGGAAGDKIMFPANYISARRSQFLSHFEALFQGDQLATHQDYIYGFSFWLQRGSP